MNDEQQPAEESEVSTEDGEAPVSEPVGEGAAPVTTEPTSPLSAAIHALVQEKQDTWNRLLRTAAEFDNFKKRSKRDLTDSTRRAEDRVVLDFLPIIDNLERALVHTEGEGGLTDGVRMVHRQFHTTLEKYDIHPFDSVGQPFDPERHEAIQQMPSELAAGSICNELQRGYIRGDRLVRPALVVVSSGPPPEAVDAGGESSQAEDQ